MNLHIVSNSAIVNDFIENLSKLNLLQNNLIVVRDRKSNYVINDPPCAPLYSSRFKSIIGDLSKYDNVFIHQFSPLMYRWVASSNFNQLNWIVWGADLYNISAANEKLYEELTYTEYVKKNELCKFFTPYNAKVLITNSVFKNKAYAKVDNVLTWMNSEYDFAKRNIKNLKAKHQYFMYGSQQGFTNLYTRLEDEQQNDQTLRIIVGNSGTPTNNHLDSLKILIDNKIKAHLIVPLSYGEDKYISFLKDKFNAYTIGTVEFIVDFMSLSEYINLLRTADALIMNCVRPQGFGNIFMMMLLRKAVFFNKHNYSLPDLNAFRIDYYTLEDLPNWASAKSPKSDSADSLLELISQEKLDKSYVKLFS